MTIARTILAALEGIRMHPLRAALTMLGVVIGVASIIAMLSLGNGARAAVEANFRYLGSDKLDVRVRTRIADGEIVPVGHILSYDDGLSMPAELPLIKAVSMSVAGQAKARYGHTGRNVSFAGVMPDMVARLAVERTYRPAGKEDRDELTALDYLQAGRFFSQAELLTGEEVCALGNALALDLFGEDDPLGQLIWVGRMRCRVVGVLAPLTSDGTDAGPSPDETLYLPISVVINALYEREPSVRIIAETRDARRMRETRDQLREHLRKRHVIEADEQGVYDDDFTILTRQDALAGQLAAARTFSILLAGMGVVSLIVGGIGIMNMMLVTVTERTREIGVRMAVGARPADIVAQFLLQAALISVIGGALGTAIGILATPLAGSLNAGPALLAPWSVPLALIMALGVGVVFGLLPAVRAAQLEPIAALRYE